MFTPAERRHLVRLVGAMAVPAMAVGVVAGVLTMPVPDSLISQVATSPVVKPTPTPSPVPIPVPVPVPVETTRVVPGPTTTVTKRPEPTTVTETAPPPTTVTETVPPSTVITEPDPMVVTTTETAPPLPPAESDEEVDAGGEELDLSSSGGRDWSSDSD